MSQQKQQQPREHKEVDWRGLASATGPYPVDAFHFVREGLSYAAHRVHDDVESIAEQDRHITGQQLCLGLRDFAIDRYGMLAPAVLGHWNIRRTEDFGRIVFAMVEHGLLSKTSDDTLEDFRSVYDFQEAFSANEVATRIGAN
ncbi:MAG TPA: Minf_1886 family protein [Phycisphaerales bacterium]|nr:Minf_1886 family protein [Phycisphaerales bacterium]